MKKQMPFLLARRSSEVLAGHLHTEMEKLYRYARLLDSNYSTNVALFGISTGIIYKLNEPM